MSNRDSCFQWSASNSAGIAFPFSRIVQVRKARTRSCAAVGAEASEKDRRKTASTGTPGRMPTLAGTG